MILVNNFISIEDTIVSCRDIELGLHMGDTWSVVEPNKGLKHYTFYRGYDLFKMIKRK